MARIILHISVSSYMKDWLRQQTGIDSVQADAPDDNYTIISHHMTPAEENALRQAFLQKLVEPWA